MKNSLKKILSKIGIAMMAVLPLVSVGTAFSLWYFGETQPVSKKADTKDYIDDVKPNYKFSVNLYDVYFFPNKGYIDLILGSSMTSTILQSGRDAVEAVLDTYNATAATNYWKNNRSTYSKASNYRNTSVGADFFGYWDGETGDAKYAYKHITVETALTQAQFESIGQPKTKALDHNSWPTSFGGWTCYAQNAKKWSLLTYGDFKYAKLFEPLRTINEVADTTIAANRSIDGSYVGNKIVFLYPVFSAGGTATYAPDNISGLKTVLRIHGNSTYTHTNGTSYNDEFHMSRSGTTENNTSIYTYHNLLVDSKSIYYLDFALLNTIYYSFGAGGPGWLNYVVGTNVDISSKTSDASKLSSLDALFIGSESGKTNPSGSQSFGEGLYNVYAYVHYNDYPAGYTSNVSTDFNNVTTATTPLKLCQTYGGTSRARYNGYYSSYSYVDIYVKIEKIDSFHLGGISSPLTTDAPLFIRYDSGSSNSAPYVDFQLNNLFIDGDKSKGFRNYSNNGAIYGFQSTVFTIISDVFTFDQKNIQSLTQSEVTAYNTAASSMYPNTHKDFYPTDKITGSTTKKVFDGGYRGEAVPSNYFNNTANFPVTFKQSNFFRVTSDYSNYYDVLIRVYYDTSAAVSKIGVAVAPHTNNSLNIWIYDGAKVARGDLKHDDDGFINNDEEVTTNVNSNYEYLIGVITLSEGGILANDTSVTSYNNYITSTTSPTVADYLGTDKYFQDHLTGLSLDVGETIAKNYVVLLQSKTA